MSSPSTLNSAYDEKLTQLLIEYKEFCLESVAFFMEPIFEQPSVGFW